MPDNNNSGISYEKRKVIFQNAVSFNILPDVYSQLVLQDKPKVSNISLLLFDGVTLTITNFFGGSDNQVLRLLGDGIVIIKNNANIKTNTGADKVLGLSKVYRFNYINGVWYEDD